MKRHFLLICLTFIASVSVAMAEPSPEAIEMAKNVPIADMHMHAYRRDGPRAAEVLEQMDKNGVRWGGAVGDFREDVAKLLGSRYIPALGQAEFARVFFSKGEQALMDGNRPLEPQAREVEFFPMEEVLHEEVKIHRQPDHGRAQAR